MSEPEVVVLPDPDAVSLAAAERIAATLTAAVGARGVAHWATTGGTAPAPIYRHLAEDPLRMSVPWDQVQLWWGDDRFVPHDHPLSNVGAAFDVLLGGSGLSSLSGSGESGVDVLGGRRPGAPIPADHVHPFPTGVAIGEGRDPDWCAALYEKTLRDHGPAADDSGWPAFDLVLLGLGNDGHLLSIFPGSDAFDRPDWVVGVPAPSHIGPHVPRVSLNPRVLDAARSVLLVTHGPEKASILAEVLGPERDERRWPAQVARRAGATWLLDGAAAAIVRLGG